MENKEKYIELKEFHFFCEKNYLLFSKLISNFEKEKSFGKKIYYTAWAIEILAALIGLLIATIIAHQAYYNLPDAEKNLWCWYKCTYWSPSLFGHISN